MKRLATCFMACALLVGWSSVSAQETAPTSMGYGIRVYSSTSDATQLVSFPVDNPSEEKVLLDLSEYKIMAATCHDNIYYLIHSDDGVLASKFLTLNLNTMAIDIVKTYDWKFDVAGNIIYSDMTYDTTSGMIYAAGYNMNNAEAGDDEEPSAPFGIFTINPATGEATLVGEQDETMLVSIMIDNDGSLLGIDNYGYLWDVSKWAGMPNYDLVNLGVTPVGLQSMAHDFGKGVSYWASYTADQNNNGVSQLIKFMRNDDWEYEKEEVGPIGINSEIIGLYIDSNPLPSTAPSVVENLSVTPGAQGAPQAMLKWKNPSKTIGGDALDKVDIKIYRNDELVATLTSLAAGSEQTWTDKDVVAGNYTYSVAAANPSSDGRKVFASEMWIGEDVPGAPVVKAVATGTNSITISWSAPESGLHGGWYDATGIAYNVTRRPDGVAILTNSTANSFTDEGLNDMHGYYYEVTAMTPAGEGGKGKSEPVVVGNPHSTPYTPDFNDNDVVNQWKIFDSDNDGYAWYIYTTGWGGTFDAFFRYNPENVLNPETATSDWLISPLVNLEKGKLYVAKYDLRLLGDLFPANITFAMGKSQTPEGMNIKLTETDGEVNDIEWITHAVPFTVEESGAYSFGIQIRNAVPTQFYKFVIEEVAPVDVAVGALNGNTMANVGTESLFSVDITNHGFNDVDEFTINLVDENGNIVASSIFHTAIPSQKTTKVEVAWTPEKVGKVSLKAHIIAEGDADASNDFGEALNITVLGEGEMIHVKDGTTGTGYAPFYGTYLHSAVQTIYPADVFGNVTDVDINAIVYYIYTAMSQEKSTIDFDVALACVDRVDFADKQMVAENLLSPVYSGKLEINPADKTVTIVFDTPFHYTGGNLCVFTRHDSNVMTPIFFEAAYSTSDPLYHTCLYRGDTRFDFSQQPNGSYHDLPNASFFVSSHLGVNNPLEDGTLDVRYSDKEDRIIIDGEYDVCRVYTLFGQLIGEYSGASEINISTSGNEIIIVNVKSANENVVKKFMTR